MRDECIEFEGIRIFQLCRQGAELRNADDAIELISASSGCLAEVLVIPQERLPNTFFDLRTRLAGSLMQKFAMYGARVAVLGDFDLETEASRSFAALVKEANRGRDFWFVRSIDELLSRMRAAGDLSERVRGAVVERDQ